MRNAGIVVSLVLATALGGAVAYRARSSPAEISAIIQELRGKSQLLRVSETGALHRFAADAFAQEKGEKAPALSLTASDGTGLRLTALSSKGLVQGALAFTEMRLVFENPEDRQLEGTFRITLPQGAAISRFAMRMGENWQEGEVVETQAARRAYEDFLHKRQDPALLEQAAGNEFSARVFPIPARGRKELIVSYSQELTRADAYVVPLAGLPVVGELEVSVSAAGDDAPLLGYVHVQNSAPAGDFVVPPSKLAAQAGEGLRNGDLVLVRVKPEVRDTSDAIDAALVLVDTSASRSLGFEAQIEAVSALASRLGDAKLVVAAFDQGIDLVYEGKASSFADKGARALRERGAFGASDLYGALAWASAKAAVVGARRVLLVGDGVATLGATDAPSLKEASLALKKAGVERMDALAVGGIRDDALLKTLVTAGLARDGVVVDADKGSEEVARRLATRTVSKQRVQIEGASWQWPEQLEGLQAGDEALVYAQLPEKSEVRVKVGQADAFVPKLAAVDRRLIERAWARAKIGALSARSDAPEAKQEIIRLSTTHRVLSPFTALLVLETEADYARFKIDRNALASVLTLDGTRLVAVERRPFTQGARQDVPIEMPLPAQPNMDPLGAPAGAAPGDRDGLADSVREAEAREEAPSPAAAPAGPAPTARARNLEMPKPSATNRGTSGGGGLPTSPPPLRREAADMDSASAPREQMAAAAAAPTAMPTAAPAASVAAVTAPLDVLDRQELSRRPAPARPPPGGEPAPEVVRVSPYAGKMADVMNLLEKGDKQGALAEAIGFWRQSRGDVMALVALGEVFEAMGELRSAARAYGSIIDLFPARADLRRMAGERLERLQQPSALAIAADSFAKSVEQRPDHPAGHRLLAFSLLRLGAHEDAFAAILRGVNQSYPSGRFRGVDRILREDMELIGAAWRRVDPAKAAKALPEGLLRQAGYEQGPSVRFVLNWETDANDVDFHIHDAKGGHAYYGQKVLPSGGELYDDVTTGYGPECFTVRLDKNARSAPYKLQAQYYSRGPMGYGMGKLQIIEHDGKGNLTFEERPFVIMTDRAFVELGTYPAPTAL